MELHTCNATGISGTVMVARCSSRPAAAASVTWRLLQNYKWQLRAWVSIRVHAVQLRRAAIGHGVQYIRRQLRRNASALGVSAPRAAAQLPPRVHGVVSVCTVRVPSASGCSHDTNQRTTGIVYAAKLTCSVGEGSRRGSVPGHVVGALISCRRGPNGSTNRRCVDSGRVVCERRPETLLPTAGPWNR